MTNVFASQYAEVYDLLYSDKDYKAEASYVCDLIRQFKPNASSILEYGVGTGRHSRLIAEEGYRITGVDSSEDMLRQARSLRSTGIEFHRGDIKDFTLDRKFDVAIALFHVMSYLNSNDDLKMALANVRRQLGEDGLFIFDFWYGPAVLTIGPKARIKKAEDPNCEIMRYCETVVDYNKNVAAVNYTIYRYDKKSNQSAKIIETHSMRYLFIPELFELLGLAGFKVVNTCEWQTNFVLSEKTWNGMIVARAV